MAPMTPSKPGTATSAAVNTGARTSSTGGSAGRWLRVAIFLLDLVVVAESVFMMSLATNPFFGAMDHPTAPFIAFMVLQIAFLGGGLILGCGSCARNDKFVHANWVLFVVNAVNYAIYAVVFGASANYGGMVAAAALASATGIGALLCRRYAITLTRMQLPTTSPSFYQSEKLYV